MDQFNYYQIEGGDEEWKIVDASKVSTLPPHMFRTILAIDTPPTDTTTKEGYLAIKYAGPLYFDLDDSESPASTARHLLSLIEKLSKNGVKEAALEVYASGGKGFHLLVAPEVFIEKPAKGGYTFLPNIYKEIAFELSVPSLDFRVYSARRGRMLRVAGVERPNKLFKVQVHVDEVRKIAEAPRDEAEALYKELCAKPRQGWAVDTRERAFGLQALFVSSKKKVEALGKKAAKMKPVDLPDELPSFEAMLRGEGIDPDASFHALALQITITAHARGIDCETLVACAEGLVQNHVSDGHRYDTPEKRRHELRRMFDYTEDNPCYQYSAGAIRSLLSHQAADLAGIEASREEIEEGIANPEESNEYDHAGVILTQGGVSIPVEGGVKRALALNFTDVTEMVSSKTGNATVLLAKVGIPGGKMLGERTFELDAFSSASAFNKAVMPFGQVFVGNDPQARGVYLRLIQQARNGGRRVYVLNREGVDLVAMPFHESEEVKRGVLVCADRESVIMASNTAKIPDFNVKFVGFPNALGIYQSDLTKAPRLKDLDEEQITSLRNCVSDLLRCQTPDFLGKVIGWTTACFFRMMFHKVYGQFPLLHVNGAAGAGKTSLVKLVANLHYYLQEPKNLTPGSTTFAIKEAMAASASIPLIIDEFKPHELAHRLDEFMLLFRDAYNCREMSRGGGTRDNTDYRAVQHTQLAAPICFISEAAVSETAVMERVILMTLVKPTLVRGHIYYKHYSAAHASRHMLGILGGFLAKSLVNKYSVEELRKEFDPIHEEARMELMLQPGEADTLSAEDRKRKSGAKDRTAYNYAVLRFGLTKFNALVELLFRSHEDAGLREEISDICRDMYSSATSSVVDLQTQTIPEWLKVLNYMADMAGTDADFATYKLRKGKDFVTREGPQGPVLEIAARSCYSKYRIFCSSQNMKPLYPSEAAFLHAMAHLNSRVDMDPSFSAVGGTLSFDLDDLRMQGFIDFPER